MAYPVSILTAWLRQCLLENIEEHSYYANKTLAKNAVQYRGPGLGPYTPVVRVQGIHRVIPEGYLVTVHDSAHKILGVFTEEAIHKFASKYRKRITYDTLSTLMIVRRASLTFLSQKQVSDFSRLLFGMENRASIVFLEIHEVDVFSHCPHPVPMRSEHELSFIYVTEEYLRLLGKRVPETLFDDGLIDGK